MLTQYEKYRLQSHSNLCTYCCSGTLHHSLLCPFPEMIQHSNLAENIRTVKRVESSCRVSEMKRHSPISVCGQWRQKGHDNSLLEDRNSRYPTELLELSPAQVSCTLGTLLPLLEARSTNGSKSCLTNWWRSTFVSMTATTIFTQGSSSAALQMLKTERKKHSVLVYILYLSYVSTWPLLGRGHQPRNASFELAGCRLCFHLIYFNQM